MLWPNVMEHIRASVKYALTVDYQDIPIYLGASAAVPNNDGVYIIRGETVSNNNSCDRESTMVYVEVWVKAEAPETGDDDVTMENDHVIASWNKLAKVSYLISHINFSAGNPGYTITHERTDGDGGSFHPVAGERLTFKTTYGVSDG